MKQENLIINTFSLRLSLSGQALFRAGYLEKQFMRMITVPNCLIFQTGQFVNGKTTLYCLISRMEQFARGKIILYCLIL